MENIDIREAYRRMAEKERLKKQGWVFDDKKRTYKTLGYVLIGIGAITFFIPATTVPLIGVGCMCLGITVKQLKWDLKASWKIYKTKRECRVR